MGFHEAVLRADKAAFAKFGRPIVYTPEGEGSVSCTGIFSSGEDLDDSQWKAALQSSATLRVLKSDVPAWSHKDKVEINGHTWQVVKKLGETPGDWRLAIRTDLRPTYRKG